MRPTILHIKLVHTAIFFVLSACVLYILFSGALDRITTWTWGAVAAIVAEGIALALSGGKCPLTRWAEKLGAIDGSVADIFLPKWMADRIFPICGTLFFLGLALVIFRVTSQ